jgi:hypothetical protein
MLGFWPAAQVLGGEADVKHPDAGDRGATAEVAAPARPLLVPVTLNGMSRTLESTAYLGSWEVRDGEIVMTDPRCPVSGDTGGLGLPLRTSGDFDLECEFFMDKGEGSGAGGPVIRFDIQPNGSCYAFRYISDFNVGVVQKKTGGQPWKELGYAADVALSPSTWHALRLTVCGAAYSVSVDGKEEVSARDGSLRAGRLGLGCSVRPVRFRNVRITGGKVSAAPAWSPAEADESIRVVCADAGLGGYQGFPRLCRLKDGDILCVFYAGWSHTSPRGGLRANGGAQALCRSTDGGETWSPATIVLDSPFDDSGASLWECDDGTLRLSAYSLDHQAWVSLKDYHHYYAITSADGGRTWSGLAEMKIGDRRIGELNPWTTPRRLANGEWLWPTYWAGGAAGAGYAEWRFRAGFSRSVDGGHTWGEPEYIEAEPSLMDEGDICQFPDGSILCVLRDEKQHMWQTWSRDNGHTWTQPVNLPWYGHCPNLLRLRSGITLLAHRVPGLCVRYSLDDAKTWAGAAMIDSAGGAYSSMVELANGRVLIVYYTEGSRSQIRAQELQVRKSGIKAVTPRQL